MGLWGISFGQQMLWKTYQRAPWTEEVWGFLLNIMTIMQTQWILAFFIWTICWLICVLYFMFFSYFFPFLRMYPGTPCFLTPGNLCGRAKSLYAEDLPVGLWRLRFPAVSSENGELGALRKQDGVGGLSLSHNKDGNRHVPWTVMACIAFLQCPGSLVWEESFWTY